MRVEFCQKKDMTIQHIRNATLKLSFGGLTFLIDPYFASKHSQPALAGKSLNPTSNLPSSIENILSNVDHIIISHLHPDHFDELAQQSIHKETSILCQPTDKVVIESMGFTNVNSINDYLKLNDVMIERVPAIHGTGTIEVIMGKASGFVFKHHKEQTLYWIGDSIWCEEVQQTIFDNSPEIIVCHAGGNKFFKEHPIFGEAFKDDSDPVIMDVEQVIELAYYAITSKIIATHIGALDHETVTRQQLRELAQLEGINSSRLFIPMNGKLYNF